MRTEIAPICVRCWTRAVNFHVSKAAGLRKPIARHLKRKTESIRDVHLLKAIPNVCANTIDDANCHTSNPVIEGHTESDFDLLMIISADGNILKHLQRAESIKSEEKSLAN